MYHVDYEIFIHTQTLQDRVQPSIMIPIGSDAFS